MRVYSMKAIKGKVAVWRDRLEVAGNHAASLPEKILSLRTVRRLGLFGISFLICVVFPTLLSFFYVALIGAEQFESEARFAVRSPDTKPSPATDALAMLSTFAGVKSTTQDAFIVADYVRSRTIIEDLGGKHFVQTIYARKEADWLSRLKSDASLEDILHYWRSNIQVSIDTQSNIVTLRVLTFRPEDSKTLAEQIIKRSEMLVNEISMRSRRDAYARSEYEVQIALKRLATLRAALLSFRNRANTIDPVASATSIGETLTLLTREKIALEGSRSSLLASLDKNAPTVRFLATQIESLDEQIAKLQSRLTSHVKGLESFAGQLADYEDLKLQNQFAEKLLEIAQGGLERARREQEQQQLYLVTIVQPTLPEEAKYPRPFTGPLMVFALCLVAWSMISVVIGSVNDHIG